MQRETIEQRIAHQTLATRTRRHFLQNCATGIGGLWLATQAQAELPTDATKASASPLSVSSPPLPAKVKRVIYLHMAGSPPQQNRASRIMPALSFWLAGGAGPAAEAAMGCTVDASAARRALE